MFVQGLYSHPRQTVNNIALSLGKRIVQIVRENIGNRLNQLKHNLLL